MGKGSSPRPIPNQKQFEDNWDKIFGKKEKNGRDVTDSVKSEKTKK
jgi:hypothetical protein